MLNTFIYRWQSIVEDAKRKLESRNDEDGTPIYNHKTILCLVYTCKLLFFLPKVDLNLLGDNERTKIKNKRDYLVHTRALRM